MKFVVAALALLFADVSCDESRELMHHEEPAKKTYHPGAFHWGNQKRDVYSRRVSLANGLMGRPISYSNEYVFLDAIGMNSTIKSHTRSDGGDIIPKEDGTGYYYVSNDENGSYNANSTLNNLIGGAYTFEFNNEHQLVDFYRVLNNTAGNCAGGKTPWGTWVSCEERTGYGYCWQVDPANKDMSGETKPDKGMIAPYAGNWEAFAWDDDEKKGYLTEDAYSTLGAGAIARFTPDAAAMECYYKATKAERWCTLNSGTHDYLKLIPGTGGTNEGTFEWVATKAEANPTLYRSNEGIDIRDGILTFVAKTDQLMFFLNLKEQTYTQYSTICGDFKQQPDNIRSLGKTMYFANDGTSPNAVYGFHKRGGFFKLLFGRDYSTETAGVAFSPDNKIMYVAFQSVGVWQFWREDGYGFDDKPAHITYEVCPAWQLRGTKY